MQSTTHHVLFKVSEWNDDKVMPRSVTVDGEGDLETKLKEQLASRYDVDTSGVELVKF